MAVTDARKVAVPRAKALELARAADEVWVCKGKNVTHLDLRTHKAGDDELAALLLGPTGNLRAPALRLGKKLIVGFDETTFAQLLNC